MRRTYPQLNIRRSVALILATLLLSALLVSSLSVSVSAAESGTCGDGLTWSLAAGTLTISGEGEMTRFTELNMPPWYEQRDRITRVVLSDGVKNISPFAFYECKKLTSVYLPDSVLKIGRYAFANCEGLESIRFGPSLTTIESSAFHSCYKLVAVAFPYTLQSLGNQAFYRCESLATVTIPPHLTKMGTSVFSYCKSLVRAEFSARLGTLPEWTFYGCEKLTEVILSDTVEELESYAFKNCDLLDTVYYDGDSNNKQQIEAELVKDVPSFEQVGIVSSDVPMDHTTAGVFTEHGDGTVTQQNTTVKSDDNMTFVSVVEHTYTEGSVIGGNYTADLTVTVENKDAWSGVVDTVTSSIRDMNESFSLLGAEADRVEVIIYVKTEGGVDTTLVEEMAGRDVKMTVVSQNGSESRMDCEDLKKDELSGSYDYSHSVDVAPADKVESLGTEDCFQVKFNESASVNSEILVQLPEIPAHSNAYLYQVEKDNTLTRLQATIVDENGNAHFYLGAVNKDTEYIVGVNVPGESAEDAIVPDELLPHYGDAVDRLQKIDYVITGRESSWGLNVAQVTWIMLGVLAVCIIAVGTVMAVWNHRRLKRGYVPDMSEYEDGEPDGSEA